ncbi:MAG: AtpZ/AtpI family protein [Bacteroidetes bacterium]|nr:AtpZ/AtpI family protein [Bacteroidota bacterium]
MNNSPKPLHDKAKTDLLKYAGLASQLLVYLAIAVAAGIKIDRWIGVFPLLTILFPLLTLASIFYKLFKETGGSK